MATSNFKVFNETMSNIENDVQYLADAQRVGGVVPGVAPSALHNKLYRQVSIMVAALGQLSANRGFSVSDADLTALVAALNGALGPAQTTGTMTLYVSTTGNDTTGDGSIGLPYRTVQFAINKIPQIVNHSVIINIAAGTYAEAINIAGFNGKGILELIGNTASATVSVISILMQVCGCKVKSSGLNVTTTTGAAITVDGCQWAHLNTNFVTSSGAFEGIRAVSSFVYTAGNVLSNRSVAIYSDFMSVVGSTNNTGTGNTIGLYASTAGTIGKGGTQPAGTTAEAFSTGGVIR
ncbi:pectinesterase family protein [Paenibacillus agricola]|uniref:DUF1565 domain-containing protein n=1 Tax=Paenibacillus agricola TaxID=2716264 RepID=A0ABX0JAQ9_9BACL|nr:pectinesterase family protein [Paenibacillus agricola]NHN33577.1 hypothetical protein [Paenibacillus agricola]